MADKVIKNQAAIAAANAKKAEAARATAAAQSKASSSAITAAKALTAKLNAANQSLQASKGAELFVDPFIENRSALASSQAKSDIAAYNEAQKAEAGITIPAAQYASATDQSAYDLLQQFLSDNGLSSLVEPLKNIFESGITDGASLSLALAQTPEYKTRFSANADRVKAGLSALSPAQYVAMEDAYQRVMRNYGLPASYYTPDSTGKQSGFDKLLANDISAAELEDRVVSAQNRVLNAAPEVQQALKQFYPGITNGDILAYTLDPTNAIADIKRKIAAAEIGGAALGQGMGTSEARAKELANYGITAQQAQQGYANIAQIAPRGSQLAQFYGQSPYDQTAAEQEIFNLSGSAEAAQKRKKLTQLEEASFSGKSGTASNALSRDRAVSPYMLGMPGAGAY